MDLRRLEATLRCAETLDQPVRDGAKDVQQGHGGGVEDAFRGVQMEGEGVDLPMVRRAIPASDQVMVSVHVVDRYA